MHIGCEMNRGVAQLVAHRVWDARVASSSLVAPTIAFTNDSATAALKYLSNNKIYVIPEAAAWSQLHSIFAQLATHPMQQALGVEGSPRP
jgi:hypothetical protein